MAGDEFECIMTRSISIALNIWSAMYGNGFKDKIQDQDYKILKNTKKDIFNDKTKTKQE